MLLHKRDNKNTLGVPEGFHLLHPVPELRRCTATHDFEWCSPPSLGYKLFQLGFTWFKDWYFAEGFWEGGVKLQGEKTNEQNRNRQLEKIQWGGRRLPR
ncbi:MAG: DUF1122 family protein [Candidatus Freyarchaeota archaeon]